MEPGKLLGDRYRLDERVDGGGMGDVWRGRDTRLDRTVAIKVLHSGLSGDATFRQRFHGEARAVAALQAPGVVNLFDYGEDTTEDSSVVSYLVMEFVPGRSLRHILADRKTLPPDEVLDIVAQSADALAVAHAAGIVHRDVKPGNILIKPESGEVKIVDFGIARTRGASSLTETGTIMGSVSYVSPEQLYGQELTGASDVYSLGIVAYECLSGRKPFPGDIPATIIAEQLHKAPPPLPAEVPAEVAAVVMRALEKQPADRWEDAAAFAAACRDLQSTGPIPASGSDPDATVVVSTPPSEAETTVLKPPRDTKAAVRSGASAAATPATPQAPPRDPAGPAPRRSSGGRARVFAVAAVVVALLTVGGIAAARQWDDNNGGGQAIGGDSSDAAKADNSSQDDDTEKSTDSPDSSTATEPSSAAESSGKSPTPTKTKPSSGPTTHAPTAEVPELLGMTENEASSALAAAGFTTYGSYTVGDGDIACTVVEQFPESGEKAELDEAISFGIQYESDPEDCPGAISGSQEEPSK